MSGQPPLQVPVPAALFLGIECTEVNVEQPTGMPSNLVLDAPPAPDWRLLTKFQVGGFGSHGFKALNIPGEVRFYLEGIGSAASEVDIGPIAINSNTGTAHATEPNLYEYEVKSPDQPATTLNEGPYKITAVIRFPAMNVTAFLEGPLIQQDGP